MPGYHLFKYCQFGNRSPILLTTNKSQQKKLHRVFSLFELLNGVFKLDGVIWSYHPQFDHPQHFPGTSAKNRAQPTGKSFASKVSILPEFKQNSRENLPCKVEFNSASNLFGAIVPCYNQPFSEFFVGMDSKVGIKMWFLTAKGSRTPASHTTLVCKAPEKGAA